MDVIGFSAGMKKRDVIISINGKAVQSTEDVSHAVQSAESLHVAVQRANETVTLTIIPDEL